MKPTRPHSTLTAFTKLAAISLPLTVISHTSADYKRWPLNGQPGHALAVQVDDRPLLHTAQLMAWDASGQVSGDARAQAARALAHLKTTLETAGSKMEDVVRINVYVTSDDTSIAMDDAVATAFARHPVTVTYVRSSLSASGALVAIDAVAGLPGTGKTISDVTVPSLPTPAVGSHGRALPPGPKTFISGQVETAPDLGAATAATLASLGRGLDALKLSKKDVVQVKAFFKPFEERAALEAATRAYFAGGPVPPLILVEWRSARPTEIEFTLAGPVGGTGSSEPLRFTGLPGLPSTHRFSRAVIMNGGQPLIFTMGLYGRPDGGPREETKEVFEQLGALLFETGSSFRTLVKGIYYTNHSQASALFGEIRDVYYDPTRPPASSGVSVPGVGRPGRCMTLELIAVPRPPPPKAP